MASALGLVQLASADEVMAEGTAGTTLGVSDPLMFADKITQYVRKCWTEARDFKQQHHEGRFVAASCARRGVYSAAKLREIQTTGGSTEYARIVANKSRVLESWLKDIFLAQGERPWTISPTPEPDLPDGLEDDIRAEVSQWLAQVMAQGQQIQPTQLEQVMGERIDAERTRIKEVAERRANRMEQLISDQLTEGGFDVAFAEFIAHLTTYPAAIFKGPIFRSKDKIRWTDADGTYIPEVSSDIVMEFEAVNPFNAYPAPGATTPQEGYFIEHMTLTARDLYALIGLDGYDEVRIRRVLTRFADLGGYRWLDATRDKGGEEVNTSGVTHRSAEASYIDVLEFHGPVSGAYLAEWGVEGVDSDPQRYYEATVWLIDDEVIKATLNDDPMGRRPYYRACYEPVPGQFWGHSMYDALADVQGVCNAAIRSLVNNMAIASGPQAVVNVDRVPAGEDITNLYPWKIWQVNDSQLGTTGLPPVTFFQPNTNVNELLAVLDKFYALADDFSMIPRYMSGSDKVSGPGRTASGLSMLLDAANKGLKSIVQGIDQGVMTPLLETLFDHNMIYSDDDSIKGDAQVVARGVSSLMQLETLRMRRNEFLQITNNPVDNQIVGLEGRAVILREFVKTLGVDANKVIPPNAGAQAQAQQAQMQQAQAQQAPAGSNEQLMDGTPTTDVASPSGMMG